MKNKNFNRSKKTQHRHQRILKQVRRGNEHLRLRITKSNSHIYAQLLDDDKQITVLSSSSLQLKLPNGNVDNAKLVGQDLAKKMLAANISEISFDRGGYKYHGRVAAIAEELRANKIKV